ncbi:hypothetical protein V0M98_34065 (plasmid) [Pseudomonas silesiensis]|uniref:hypothetical protein n=1 Tax=Pseudomonas silesiensis TaxID=1853130 RepID=UPI0030CB64D7
MTNTPAAPVDAILLSDCVPGLHPDYNEGLFATSDAVRQVYLLPPGPVSAVLPDGNAAESELAALREDLERVKANSKQLAELDDSTIAQLGEQLKTAQQRNEAMAEYLVSLASELRSAGNKGLQYSSSTTDNAGLAESFLQIAAEIDSLLDPVKSS